jgi:glycerate kinase
VRILLAPNPFKGSLSAAAAARAMADGLAAALPGAELDQLPLADGGEGTVECIAAAAGGRRIGALVAGPFGKPVKAAYLLLPDGTAVIEIAAASGLTLISPDQRDPMTADSRGTGQLIVDALERGARHIVLALGGSATVDGGTGIAVALGARFLDETGREAPPGGRGMGRIREVDLAGWDPRLKDCRFTVAADVDNPLLGPRGAAAVFGPQKGATPEQVRELEHGLAYLAAALARAHGRARADRVPGAGGDRAVADVPGAGAAGGVGAMAAALLGAEIVPGAEYVMDAVGFDAHLGRADLVVTGEGRLDAQTAHGKGPHAVAARARRAGVPVVALVGAVAGDGSGFGAFDLVMPIVPGPCELSEAMVAAEDNLRAAARRLGLALDLGGRLSRSLGRGRGRS